MCINCIALETYVNVFEWPLVKRYDMIHYRSVALKECVAYVDIVWKGALIKRSGSVCARLQILIPGRPDENPGSVQTGVSDDPVLGHAVAEETLRQIAARLNDGDPRVQIEPFSRRDHHHHHH